MEDFLHLSPKGSRVERKDVTFDPLGKSAGPGERLDLTNDPYGSVFVPNLRLGTTVPSWHLHSGVEHITC